MNNINNNYEKFEKYFNYLVNENEKYNLTSIIKKDEVYNKHFYDSLYIENVIDMKNINSLCDIGSGAGFPGIPIAICYPNISVTVIESNNKKVEFLKNLLLILELNNVNVVYGRAEECCLEFKEKFDVVTARAVASLPIILELLSQFAKVKGLIVAYKGDKGNEELKTSEKAINLLNCKLVKIKEYELLNNYGKRSLIVLEKENSIIDKYPRRYAEIKKKPL